MRKLKLQQLGLALCGLCLGLFAPMNSGIICMLFFGEPEFPEPDL